MRKLTLAIAAAAMTVPAIPMMPEYTAEARGSRYYNGPTWRDRQGRVRCRRSNGTTGLIVGGAAGALTGRAIDTHGSRATGTILGAAAGALLGRELQRGGRRCR